MLLILPLLAAGLVSTRAEATNAPVPPRPEVGFTFRPYTAAGEGIDPQTALSQLLADIQPDVVRLPVYWSDVSPAPTTMDFTASDRLVDVVAAHDATSFSRRVSIVLVVGMRNVSAPELWAPPWALTAAGGKVAASLASLSSFDAYLEATIAHYSGNPLLRRWQVENEPLDDSVPASEGDTTITEQQMRRETDVVRRLDPRHPVMVTTFTSSAVDLDLAEIARADEGIQPPPGPQPGGHPEESLLLGDTLGVDLYVVYAAVDLGAVDAQTRIVWKRNGLGFWTQRAARQGKDLWVTEMQAAPWTQVDGFTIDDLMISAEQYRGQGAAVVLLWGVEQWLTSPQWLGAGLAAVQALRATG